MIDKDIFAHQMGVLGDRFGRVLASPTLRTYYEQLNERLTTEQFVAATTLLFRTFEYKGSWPNAEQIIGLVLPAERPTLSALEAFEQVNDIVNWGAETHAVKMEKLRALGAVAVRAFRACGGFRELWGALEKDLPFIRMRFVEAYEGAAESAVHEQNATLALESANEKVSGLIAGVARARSLPERAGPSH